MIYKQLGAMVVLALQQDWEAVEKIAKEIRITMDKDGNPIPKALAMEAFVRPEEANAEDRLDAIRYRYLRREEEPQGAEPFICRKCPPDIFTRWTGRDADAAVDASMPSRVPQSQNIKGDSNVG